MALQLTQDNTCLASYLEVWYEDQDYLMLCDNGTLFVRGGAPRWGVFIHPFPHITISQLPPHFKSKDSKYKIGSLGRNIKLFGGDRVQTYLPLQNARIPEYIKTKISKELL